MILIKAVYFLLVWTNISTAQKEKISVTFIIDDTSSMSEDIRQVKNGVTSIFDVVTHSEDSRVDNFILLTFNDHAEGGHPPRRLTKTLNRNDFIRELSNIYVDNGGDCPEMALSGIKLGLQESLPGSYLYVFTDAIAKDHASLKSIRSMAIEKRAQIVFILTSVHHVCKYTYEDKGYQAYQQLANATSGQVFHMKKNDVGQILAYVKESMRKKKDPIINKIFPPGYGHKLGITVDGDMKDMLIAESGKGAELSLTSPDGTKCEVESVVDIPDAKVVKIVDPKPGNYTAKVGSMSDTSVVVTAETGATFNHGFSYKKPPSLNATLATPVEDGKYYISIQLTSEDEVNLDTLQLIGMDDKIIKEIPLKVLDAKQNLYITEDRLSPPNNIFNIAIKGLHVKSNTTITRRSRTPVEVLPGTDKNVAPTVVIDKGPTFKVKHDDPLTLVCQVKGNPRPDVIWTDESGKILPASATVVKSDKYDMVLQVEKVTKHSTYKCAASNIHGDAGAEVVVDIAAFITVVDAPKNTSIEYMKSDKIYCQINADPPADIAWLRNGSAIETDHHFDILDSGNTLVVKQMLPDFVGEYTCLAKNEYKLEEFKFQIEIIGAAPNVSINGPAKILVEYNKQQLLICRVSGYPKPDVRWYDAAYEEELPSSLTSSKVSMSISEPIIERTLKIEHVNRNATYKCKASNSVGEDSANVTVETLAFFEITEPPKDTIIEYKKEGKIFCRVAAQPPAQTIWIYKNKPLKKNVYIDISPDNTTLIIKNMQPVLMGFYYCQLSNQNNFTNLLFKIDIGGLIKPVVDKTVRSVKVLEGKSADIRCNVTQGTPAPTFSWKFKPDDERKFIVIEGTENNIHFEDISREQSGGYRCIASNPLTSDYHTTYLIVEYPPSIEEPEGPMKAEAAKKVTLKCLVRGEPIPAVTWSLNGIPITDSKDYHIYRDNSLSFTGSADKAGLFNCTATNNHGTKTILTKVDFVVPVEIDIPAETKIVTFMDKEVNLDCVAEGFPVPSIKWLFYNSSAESGQPPKLIKTAESPDSLVLKSLQLTDDGYYTCEASNDIPSQKNLTYTIIVNGKPKIINIERTVIHAVEGDRLVRVPCIAIGRPQPDVTWLNDKGLHLAAGTEWFEIDKDGSLIIKNIDEGGAYTCVAENSFGSDSQTFNLVVKKFPLPSNPLAEYREKVSEPVEVPCPLPHEKTDLVRWYKRDKLLTTSEENQHLKFDSLSPGDKGIYTCRVSPWVGKPESASIEIVPIE